MVYDAGFGIKFKTERVTNRKNRQDLNIPISRNRGPSNSDRSVTMKAD